MYLYLGLVPEQIYLSNVQNVTCVKLPEKFTWQLGKKLPDLVTWELNHQVTIPGNLYIVYQVNYPGKVIHQAKWPGNITR